MANIFWSFIGQDAGELPEWGHQHRLRGPPGAQRPPHGHRQREPRDGRAPPRVQGQKVPILDVREYTTAGINVRN